MVRSRRLVSGHLAQLRDTRYSEAVQKEHFPAFALGNVFLIRRYLVEGGSLSRSRSSCSGSPSITLPIRFDRRQEGKFA
jgi:hypothetical protein